MKNVIVLVLVSVVACTIGCQSMENPFRRQAPAPPPDLELEGRASQTPAVSEPGLKLSPQQRFADVPLPEGVKENAERTFVYEGRGLQIGRMVYTTRKRAADLAQFYVRESPTAGWQLDNIVQADVINLYFSKPDKTLRVTITNLGVVKGRELVLLLVPKEPS